MEDSEVHNLRTETLHQQYQLVKKRTANDNTAYGSHVMQFGDIGLSKENLFLYMGANPANDNSPFVDDNPLRPPQKAVDQRDADLLHFWHKVRTFETHCGSLSQFGMKHMRSFANMCNAGIRTEQMTEASGQACARIPSGPWSSLSRRFSA